MARHTTLALLVVAAAGCGGGGSAPQVGDADADAASLADDAGPDAARTHDAAVEAPPCPAFGSPVEVGTVDTGASEVSGLVASPLDPTLLWAQDDDSGAGALLHGMTTGGRLRGSLLLEHAVVDPEDLARGPGPDPARSYLYLADTGNNDGSRDPVHLLRVAEPELPTSGPQPSLRATPDVIELVYDDGGVHDAEAILIDAPSGDLYLITKRSAMDPATRMYRGRGASQAADGDVVTLETVLTEREQAALALRVVSMDRSPDDVWVLVGARDAEYLMWPRLGRPLEAAMLGEPCRAPVPPGQIETGAFAADGSGDIYAIPEGDSPPVYFVGRVD